MGTELKQQGAAENSGKQGPESGGQSMAPPQFKLAGAAAPPGAPLQAKSEPGMVAVPAQFQGGHDNGCGCDNCFTAPAQRQEVPAANPVQLKADPSAPLQMAGGDKDTQPGDIQPSYIGKDYTTSKDAIVLTPENDKNGIPLFSSAEVEVGKNYAVTKATIPTGSKVTLVSTASSKDGSKTVEVVQVTVDEVPKGAANTLVGQTVWTTKSNISAAPGEDGKHTVSAKAANVRSEPTAIMGKESIPKGSKIQITETRGISEFPEDIRLQNNAERDKYFTQRYMRLYLKATWTDAGGKVRSGWISADDVVGGFANEVLGTSKVPDSSLIDNAPNHKTVGTAKAPLLKMGGMTYTELKTNGNKVRIEPGTFVQILKKSADGKYAMVSSEDNKVAAQWTSIGNLDMGKAKKVGEGDAAINYYPINNGEAWVRVEQQGFTDTGASLSRGEFVETYDSLDGKVQVAKVTKEGDKYTPAAEKNWIDPGHLAPGWSTDLMGTNAAWGMVSIGGGAAQPSYKGQKEFVNLGGSGGKMKQVSLEAYPNLIKMITDAKNNTTTTGAADPVNIEINSCFRTYFSQKYFKDHENDAGFNDAASPGSSDHQDSNAFDLNNKTDAKVYTWLKNNAWKYDIIQNVQKQNEKHHWTYIPGIGKEGIYTTWGLKSNQSW